MSRQRRHSGPDDEFRREEYEGFPRRGRGYYGGIREHRGGGRYDDDYGRDSDYRGAGPGGYETDRYGNYGGGRVRGNYWGNDYDREYASRRGRFEGDPGSGRQRERYAVDYGYGRAGTSWPGSDRNYGYGHGGETEESGYGPRYDDRDFWDRATDEVSSWFGDRDAQRRRDADQRTGGYRGRGPKNYTRSDERMREEVCDRLCDDGQVDASDVEVQVASGEVTLSGTVPSRGQRRRAEDCAEWVSGVQHVQNNLRVKEQPQITGSDTSTMSSMFGSSDPSTTGTRNS